jgi:hypothetical protein
MAGEKSSSPGESRLLPVATVQAWLQHKPVDQADIAMGLRDLVVSIAPQAEERILWRGLSYNDPNRGGPVKGSLCQIEFHPGHVRLSFIHGAYLPDPRGLLEGERKAKRFVKLFTYADVPWDELADLIEAASRLDTSNLPSLPERVD